MQQMRSPHRSRQGLRITLPKPTLDEPPEILKFETSTEASASTSSRVTGYVTGAAPEQPQNAVFISSMPLSVNEGLLKHLISPIGQVLSISRHRVGDKDQVVIVFASTEDAKKAAEQLDGNTVFGSSLSCTLGAVSTSPVIANNTTARAKQPNALAKKNLYIANIPHDCTEQELFDAFSQFGTVEHICVLATTDSMARRRAFVDMRSGAAARNAAANLHGTRVRGYSIDISFAHIQRSSSGDSISPLFSPKTPIAAPPRPVDSYFPAVPEMPATLPVEPSPLRQQLFSSTSTASTAASYVAPPPYDPPRPSRTIRIDNITRLAATDSDELAKWFHPYGVLLRFELIRNPDAPDQAWAQVAYNKAEDAEKAIQHLDGRVMGGARVKITRLNDCWLVQKTGPVKGRARQSDGISPDDSISNKVTPVTDSPPRKQNAGSMPLPVPQGDGAWPSLKFNSHSPVSKRTALSPRSNNTATSTKPPTSLAKLFPSMPTFSPTHDNAEDMIVRTSNVSLETTLKGCAAQRERSLVDQ